MISEENMAALSEPVSQDALGIASKIFFLKGSEISLQHISGKNVFSPFTVLHIYQSVG